jgi:hypothetical protein
MGEPTGAAAEGEVLLCSACFADHGLAQEAIKHGKRVDAPCPHCGSTTGVKMDRAALEEIVSHYFVGGSWIRTEYGGAPYIQCSRGSYGEREVSFPPWLRTDAELIEDALKVGFFYYGPPTWRLGGIEQLEAMLDPKTRHTAVRDAIGRFQSRILRGEDTFYRLRKDIGSPVASEFDAPPKGHECSGRLDGPDFSVLYGSQDLEICVHECRVTRADRCYVATLRATRPLNLLDLTSKIENDGPTEFESLQLAIDFLFSAEAHSYETTRAIAEAAREAGFDGVAYPSYLRRQRETEIPNIGLFGHPIANRRIELVCIDRLWLDAVRYETSFGPCFP